MSNTGDSSDTDDVPFEEYSQPLFTEQQDELLSSITSTDGNEGFKEFGFNGTDDGTESLQQSNIVENKSKYVPETAINENKRACEFLNDFGENSNLKRNKVEESCDNVTDTDKKCIHCVFEKELDKRNYYFGNLLIGELQFLPPCMRSHAYMNILKYVETLKYKHLNNN